MNTTFEMTESGLVATHPDLQTVLLLVLATAGLASFIRVLP